MEFETHLSNHEEADTKVIAHAIEYLSSINEKNVLIRSPSGDADIIVLCVSLWYTYKERVFIDNGTGESRKLIWLGGVNLSHEKCKALLGMHAFTGNDYVSSFFKKGKEMCWKLVRKYEKFERCFINLGMESSFSSSLFSALQEFVSMLYGTKLKPVNEFRYAIFEKKRQKENKITDMAALPPCESVLHQRANAVAYMWQNEFPNLEESSWYLNGDIQWPDDVSPQQ